MYQNIILTLSQEKLKKLQYIVGEIQHSRGVVRFRNEKWKKEMWRLIRFMPNYQHGNQYTSIAENLLISRAHNFSRQVLFAVCLKGFVPTFDTHVKDIKDTIFNNQILVINYIQKKVLSSSQDFLFRISCQIKYPHSRLCPIV